MKSRSVFEKPRKWELYPNEFRSPRGWVTQQWRTFMNFLNAALHPRLTKPKTIRKYLKVMGVYHRCMAGFRDNHRLARKNHGHSDPNAFGYQAWQVKSVDPNYDPNWEVKIIKEGESDGRVPQEEANGEDDRADSDPPKRSKA